MSDGLKRFRATVRHEGENICDLPWLEEFWAVRHEEAAARIEELEAKLQEFQKSQSYSYIGRDMKTVLARDLEDRAETAEAKLAKAVEALELAINACDQGRMVTRPGRGVGGMTIEENIRGSIYINVPAWPIEEARAALAEINGGQP